jgi:geranylgeranyl diphosphate synthase type II
LDNLNHLESIHHRKTGAMIRVSLRLGAIVAGSDAEQLAALDTYGKCLGLAFQITDDLLDVRSTEAQMGKRVGKDAPRGKLTFPGLLGLDQSAQHAQQLTTAARQALSAFGDEADGLRAVAQYVLERNR